MTSQQLLDTGFPSQVFGVIATANAGPTCTGQHAREIDHFLISSDLAAVIQSPPSLSFAVPWGPHGGLTLWLPKRPCSYSSWQMSRPQPLPLPPVDADVLESLAPWHVCYSRGLGKALENCSETQVDGRARRCFMFHGNSCPASRLLGLAATAVVMAMEEQACIATAILVPSQVFSKICVPGVRQHHAGVACPPAVPALPMATHPLGRRRPVHGGLSPHFCRRRCKELSSLGAARAAASAWRLPNIYAQDHEVTLVWTVWAAAVPILGEESLRKMACDALDMACSAAQRAGVHRARAWRAWLVASLSGSASAAFRALKPGAVAPCVLSNADGPDRRRLSRDELSAAGGGDSLELLSTAALILAARAKFWATVWGATRCPSIFNDDPLPGDCIGNGSSVHFEALRAAAAAQVPDLIPITSGHVLEACASFPRNTAVGADGTGPGDFVHPAFSRARGAIASILSASESLLVLPACWAVSSVVLLPKALDPSSSRPIHLFRSRIEFGTGSALLWSNSGTSPIPRPQIGRFVQEAPSAQCSSRSSPRRWPCSIGYRQPAR